MPIVTTNQNRPFELFSSDPIIILEEGVTIWDAGPVIFTRMNLSTPFSIQLSGTVLNLFETSPAIDLSSETGEILITETGRISSPQHGVFVGPNESNVVDVTNFGLITTDETSVWTSDGDDTIVNFGRIILRDNGALRNAGPGGALPQGAIHTEGGADLVINQGYVLGDIWLERGSGSGDTQSADTFIGRGGEVQGNIYAFDGDDVLDSRGGIVGEMHGGTGNDRYFVDTSAARLVEMAGQGEDKVVSEADFELGENFELLELLGGADLTGIGNAGQNNLTGNMGDNDLQGRGARDVISGHAGDDEIDAGRGDDQAFGGAGDDNVMGRAGRDLLDGGEGDDLLFGGLGDDTMNGGDGQDTLKGGAGADEMTGGGDGDIFVFCSVSDSPLGADDTITDFQSGQDLLDFSALPETLQLNIGGGLSGGGVPSAFVTTGASGNSRVFVDVDGDGAADMRVLLLASAGLTEADFVL